MAKVRLETGQVISFEGDPTQEQIENAIGQVTGQQGLPDKATEEQFLGTGDRVSGGFRSPQDLEQVREGQRAERGLAPGTALEPTGFNFRNLLDFPADVADAIGPAFPVIGAIGGGLAGGGATGGTAAIAGGAIGAGTLEAVRQKVGQDLLGFDQGSAGERTGRVLMESAFGALGEAGGQAFNAVLKGTKSGIIKAGNKLLNKKGIDGFVKHFGKIARSTDAKHIDFAIDAFRKGDKAILSKALASEGFADEFAKQFLFGSSDDFARQTKNLSKNGPARESLKGFYKRILNIDGRDFDIIANKGGQLSKLNTENGVLNLAKNIRGILGESFDKIGDDLGRARTVLKKQAGNIEVGEFLTQNNIALADELKRVGFLLPEDQAGKLFSINPEFAVTSTGKQQGGIFGKLVSKFFSTEGDDILVSRATKGDIEAIKKLADKGTRGKAKVFSVENTCKFGKFIDDLSNVDVQISGNEFKGLGKLSPQLVEYLRGLRGITTQVAEQVSNGEVQVLTKAFSELAENAKPFRLGSKIKDAKAVEATLRKFSNAGTDTALGEEGVAINAFLRKKFGINFISKMDDFRAAQVVKDVESPFGAGQVGRKKLGEILRNGFKASPELNDIVNLLDPQLPDGLKIGLNAKRHTTALALEKDAESLLKARFLSNAVFAGIGGVAGFQAGGPEGALGGIALGLSLQQPKILKGLIAQAGKQGARTIPQTAARQLPRGGGQAGVAALRELLSQNQS